MNSPVAVQMLFYAAFSFAFVNSLCALEKIVTASKGCKMRKKADSGFLSRNGIRDDSFILLSFWMRYYDALLSVHVFHCLAATCSLSSIYNVLSFKALALTHTLTHALTHTERRRQIKRSLM